MTGAIDPPWRLDPLQNIVNVNWGAGVFVLVWVQTTGFGHTRDGCVTQNVAPLPTNKEGDQVQFNPKLELADDSNAKILYKRVEGIIKVDNTLYSCRIDAGSYTLTDTPGGTYVYNGSNGILSLSGFAAADAHSAPLYLCGGEHTCVEWLTVAQPHPCVEAGFGTNPSPGPCSYGGFEGAYATPDEHPPIVGHTYAIHTITQNATGNALSKIELTSAQYEGIWLIKPPSVSKTTKPLFTVTVGEYACGITVLAYPTKGIKFDGENNVSMWGNQASTGRVYVPLNWSSEDKKPPKAPDGKDWPGYPLVGCPLKDVKNAVLYQGGVSPQAIVSGSRDYKFVITKDKHLKDPSVDAPQDSDPPGYAQSTADTIVQIYMDDSSAGAPTDDDTGDQFYGGRFCDVPYGLPFRNYLDTDKARGPLQKTDIRDTYDDLGDCT